MLSSVRTIADWNHAAPLIEAALATSPGFETLGDVARKFATGHYQVWRAGNSAAVTSVDVYPRKKVLTVIHGGGDLGELLEVIEPELCSYAKSVGCNAIMGTGRKGWERPSQRRGYTFGYIAMHKDLNNVRR